MRNSRACFLFIVFCIMAVIISGCTTTEKSVPPVKSGTPVAATAIMEKSIYSHTTWGYRFIDLDTGTVLAEKNAGMLFTPGSTVKCFSTAAALDLLGADYRFITPVYATGTLKPDGVLDGTLVLVASGDPTMGGRTLPDDTIEFTNVDHCDAHALPDAVMTTTDPLAGIDSLARQVKETGIVRAQDVVIDDRLYKKAQLSDASPVTPISINDNLVDILITPATEGSPALVSSRPESDLYTVMPDVTTAGTEPAVTVSEQDGTIYVNGTVPAGFHPYLTTYVVQDSAAWARSLFINALERQGVEIDAPSTGTNPGRILPANYTGEKQVAALVSPPFSENVKLILKVSQNIHANELLGIMAAHEGKYTIDDGLLIEGAFIRKTGIDPASLSIIDGEGSSGNRVSPEAAVTLLAAMAAGPDNRVYRAAMPILGVDGSLANAAAPDNPATGKINAKTGTSMQGDMNGDVMILAKGLAGYMTTKSGRDVAFALYANNIRISDFDELAEVNTDMASIPGAFFEEL